MSVDVDRVSLELREVLAALERVTVVEAASISGVYEAGGAYRVAVSLNHAWAFQPRFGSLVNAEAFRDAAAAAIERAA